MLSHLRGNAITPRHLKEDLGLNIDAAFRMDQARVQSNIDTMVKEVGSGSWALLFELFIVSTVFGSFFLSMVTY